MRTPGNHTIWFMRTAAIVAVAFGAATLRAGGAVLFGDGARTAGNVVDFVLWFNFLAGFGYVVAGAGLWARRRWSAQLALAIAAATVLVFGAFGVHVAVGGAFEARTAWAMALRSAVWILIALVARRALQSPAAPLGSWASVIDQRGIAPGRK